MRTLHFTTGQSINPRSAKLGSDENPRTLQIANNLPAGERATLVRLLTDYQDVFAWSYTDMNGLDPQYYQHQIHLLHDTRPIQQRRNRMNPNYATRVKEEIDKLPRVGFIRHDLSSAPHG